MNLSVQDLQGADIVVLPRPATFAPDLVQETAFRRIAEHAYLLFVHEQVALVQENQIHPPAPQQVGIIRFQRNEFDGRNGIGEGLRRIGRCHPDGGTVFPAAAGHQERRAAQRKAQKGIFIHRYFKVLVRRASNLSRGILPSKQTKRP